MMLDAAARLVVKVLAGILPVEAASWLADGVLGGGGFGLDEAARAALFAGVLL